MKLIVTEVSSGWRIIFGNETGIVVREWNNKWAARLRPINYNMVGARGFEPRTSRTRTVRATGLRHAPNYGIVTHAQFGGQWLQMMGRRLRRLEAGDGPLGNDDS